MAANRALLEQLMGAVSPLSSPDPQRRGAISRRAAEAVQLTLCSLNCLSVLCVFCLLHCALSCSLLFCALLFTLLFGLADAQFDRG
jgi:hypothetical protein